SVATVTLESNRLISPAFRLPALLGHIVQARNQTTLSDSLSLSQYTFPHRVPWLRHAYELRLLPRETADLLSLAGERYSILSLVRGRCVIPWGSSSAPCFACARPRYQQSCRCSHEEGLDID